jgi:hypothetical protein
MVHKNEWLYRMMIILYIGLKSLLCFEHRRQQPSKLLELLNMLNPQMAQQQRRHQQLEQQFIVQKVTEC